MRRSGIDIIGDVSWGTHFCQFYQTREDLIEILIPYFKAGLENNEFCMWITSIHFGVEKINRIRLTKKIKNPILLAAREIKAQAAWMYGLGTVAYQLFAYYAHFLFHCVSYRVHRLIFLSSFFLWVSVQLISHCLIVYLDYFTFFSGLDDFVSFLADLSAAGALLFDVPQAAPDLCDSSFVIKCTSVKIFYLSNVLYSFKHIY